MVRNQLPRRASLATTGARLDNPPMMRVVSFSASPGRVVGRLLGYCFALLSYYAAILWDRVRGRDSDASRAVHLREAFQRVGGMFIKLGQQLSLRADILPYVYCRELETLLDDVAPFDVAVARRAVGRVAGQSVDDIFAVLDPDPIGSASVACVFQAQLMDGRRVAVKVRRPGIGELFAADLKALDWLANFLEWITVFRPGFTYPIRKGLRDNLMEEMDFRREARYQELFRRNAKQRKKNFVSAPRVFPEYSGDDVIVMELVTKGLKLSEVLAAVEQPAANPAAVAMMSQLDIDPAQVARHLLWANYAGMITDPFFHSDPSAGNLFVQKHSKLVFIDFGSCGAFSQSQRRTLQQINYYQSYGDAEGMARASLALIEPLPPIDVAAFSQELEDLYRVSLYAMESKTSKWWERTTAVQWYGFMGLALKYQVPLPTVMPRMVRATLLYDTLAARLDHRVNFYDEYRRYLKYSRKVEGQRIRKDVEQQLADGFDDSQFVGFENALRTWNRIVYQAERLLDMQPLQFIYDINTGSYVVLSLIKMVAWLTIVSIAAPVPLLGYDLLALGIPLLDQDPVGRVVRSPFYVGAMLSIVIMHIRRIMYRFNEKRIDISRL
jgi:ubiquinone biosynthesis protein